MIWQQVLCRSHISAARVYSGMLVLIIGALTSLGKSGFKCSVLMQIVYLNGSSLSLSVVESSD